MSAPHERTVPALRHGGFWIPGDLLETDHGRFQRGPMWVEWFAPESVTSGLPLVLVHGGGGQGTDWIVTPDGRPGWAPELAATGHSVYVVDRPGHGRSPHHPAVMGEPADQMPIEGTIAVFADPGAAADQTQWPWRRDPEGDEVAQLAASNGFLLQDLGESQELDAHRLFALLELIGPAILVTHSAGAPSGWLTASRSEDVRAIVAIEPMGPPYLAAPGLGELTHGLTAVPLAPRGLAGIAVKVVTGAASPFAKSVPPTVEYLRGVGADAQHIPLESRGLTGNGHGLMFEANSDETAAAIAGMIAGLT